MAMGMIKLCSAMTFAILNHEFELVFSIFDEWYR